MSVNKFYQVTENELKGSGIAISKKIDQGPQSHLFWNEHSEQARAPHTNGARDVPRYGALSLL